MSPLAQEAAQVASNIDWGNVFENTLIAAGAIGLWWQSRSTKKKVEETKEVAENGHVLREKMATENDDLRQKVAGLEMSNQELSGIVRYMRSRPEPQIQQALTVYRERRQVRVYDPQIEGPFAPPTPTAPAAFPLPTWALWALAGTTGTIALAYALVRSRRVRWLA